MNIKTIALASLLMPAMAFAQDNTTINDSNTPLHLLKPDYKHGYGVSTKQEVKAAIDRVMNYILANPKQFRTTSYEWGVTYSACLDAAKASGDRKYAAYVEQNFKAIADAFPGAMKDLKKGKTLDTAIRKVVDPHALDDAGAICAAMIKAELDARKNPKTRSTQVINTAPVIENYSQYIMTKEFRLADGTFARKRPHKNTVWLDDMFMAIPAIAYMGAYTNDSKYFDEAAKQIMLFKDKMWVKEKKLFRHGWVEAMTPHPAFHWGRANGWAILTMCEVLDVLPENHPQRGAILDLLRQHIEGLVALQGKGWILASAPRPQRLLRRKQLHSNLYLLYSSRHQPRLDFRPCLWSSRSACMACRRSIYRCPRSIHEHLRRHRYGLRPCFLYVSSCEHSCCPRLWSCHLGRCRDAPPPRPSAS